MKAHVHSKTCAQIFTAVLFIVAKKWKPFKCRPTDEQINKIWCVHTQIVIVLDLWHPPPLAGTKILALSRHFSIALALTLPLAFIFVLVL